MEISGSSNSRREPPAALRRRARTPCLCLTRSRIGHEPSRGDRRRTSRANQSAKHPRKSVPRGLFVVSLQPYQIRPQVKHPPRSRVLVERGRQGAHFWGSPVSTRRSFRGQVLGSAPGRMLAARCARARARAIRAQFRHPCRPPGREPAERLGRA